MFIARWDLDKTYIRTDFDTLRDLLRTAVQRPDQKRTVPGAAALMRQLNDAGAQIHILSGSPEQLRGRLVEKLRLDGVHYASLTLKPNLQNLLRLRFKAVRGQLGYKLPALLRRRCELPSQRDLDDQTIKEVLLGDDAEADAFVYTLYADICAGLIDEENLISIMRAGDCYEDDIQDAVRLSKLIEPDQVVQRILIHLDRQTSPTEFGAYGPRVVPFYNYLQAAFVFFDDGLLSAKAVLRVAQDLAAVYHFEGGAMARSYLELVRRRHVSGRGLDEIVAAYSDFIRRGRIAAAGELGKMVEQLESAAPEIHDRTPQPLPVLDHIALARGHNRRRHR